MSIPILDNELGMYQPAFFYMRLNFEIDFFNAPLIYANEEKLSTFVHEYVHYLQDISTVYGLFNISNIFGRIGGFIREADQSQENPIKVPITLNSIPNSELTSYFLDNVLGSTCNDSSWSYDQYLDIIIDDIETQRDDYIVEIFELPSDEYENQMPPKIKLELQHTMGKSKKEFSFGAMAIMESMANLIEKHIFPCERKYYQVQYDIVEIMCNSISFLNKNKAFMVALCDASLMYHNPGLVFISALIMMRRKKYIPNKIDDIYSFVFGIMEPPYKDLYDQSYNSAIQHISNLLPANHLFYHELHTFVIGCLNKSTKLRNENMNFLSSIMEMDSIIAKNYIVNEVINKLDFTLVLDKDANENALLFSRILARLKGFLIQFPDHVPVLNFNKRLVGVFNPYPSILRLVDQLMVFIGNCSLLALHHMADIYLIPHDYFN